MTPKGQKSATVRLNSMPNQTMKTTKGNYEGASMFAEFDKPVSKMTLEECRGLLEQILYRAMPGEDNADAVFKELAVAEQCAKEGRLV